MNGLALCICLAIGGPPREVDRWFAEDKYKHFVASFVVTSLAASGARAAGLAPDASLIAGATVGGAAGVWKEWRDTRLPGGAASGRDLVWDAAGIGAALAIAHQGR